MARRSKSRPLTWSTLRDLSLGQALVGAVLLLFVGALIVILSPIGLVMTVVDRQKYREFCKREAGRVYLVCTSRRKWHDFICNNVIPILPDHYEIVWRLGRSPRGGTPPLPFAEFAKGKIHGVPKPYLVVVTPRGLAHRSLNAILAEQKKHQERSEQARAACRDLIDRIEAELLRSGTLVKRTVPGDSS